jgi:putative transposase
MSDPRFRRSAGGISSLGLHPASCPKDHRRVLDGPVAVRLNDPTTLSADESGWPIVARAGVMPDHVHVFVLARAADSPAEVARRFKGRTSRVLGQEFMWLGRQRVMWSTSSFVASIGDASEQTVRRYGGHRWDDAA